MSFRESCSVPWARLFTRPARTRGDCAPGSYGGGKLETGKGRGLIAGHVIGLRRIGAAVNRCVTRTLGPAPLSGKGWVFGQKRKPRCRYRPADRDTREQAEALARTKERLAQARRFTL
jgi:hypothetical protein